MRFTAYDVVGAALRERVYYSVGGGFVVDESAIGAERIKPDDTSVPYPFTTAADLLALKSRVCHPGYRIQSAPTSRPPGRTALAAFWKQPR